MTINDILNLEKNSYANTIARDKTNNEVLQPRLLNFSSLLPASSLTSKRIVQSYNLSAPALKHFHKIWRHQAKQNATAILLSRLTNQSKEKVFGNETLNLSTEEINYFMFLSNQLNKNAILARHLDREKLYQSVKTVSQANGLYEAHQDEYLSVIRQFYNKEALNTLSLDMLNCVMYDFTQVDEHQVAEKLKKITEKTDKNPNIHKHILFRLSFDTLAMSKQAIEEKLKIELCHWWAKLSYAENIQPIMYLGFLMAKGFIDPSQKNTKNQSFLHIASQEGNTQFVINHLEFLIDQYPKQFVLSLLRQQDDKNNKPEDAAYLRGDYQLSRYLNFREKGLSKFQCQSLDDH